MTTPSRVRLAAMPALLAGILLSVAAAEQSVAPKKPEISLTLIPPSPVTDKVAVTICGAVWNRTNDPRAFDAAIYLNGEQPENLLHRVRIDSEPQSPGGFRFCWPANRVGRHQLILAVQSEGQTVRCERPLEVLPSDVRSTRRLGGAWVDLYHHDEGEGRPFNAELAAMTDSDWRQLVGAMHESGQDIMVITMMFQNFTHRGRHSIEQEGYQGRAYYPSKLFPGRMPIASRDPLEAILSEADRLGMQVLPGVGCYAFFDYTPGSLAWHKRVADELWQCYGHHPSFYGWYVSGEKDGSLGGPEERREIVEFFREFRAHVRRLAPDKPVMLATNCFHLPGAEDTYRRLLPYLDILCPFGFHRMPTGDLSGEEAAVLLQSLCEEAGCHLWMDLESFVFRNGRELHPRPIAGLLNDFTRFPNFEKTLHYQFPGMMSSPKMARQPGGPASVKLYEDYRRFLREGPPKPLAHAARNRPVRLAAPPDPRYPAVGASSLVDGRTASEEYRDPQWAGWFGNDLVATIDMGSPVKLESVAVRCLQFARAGICLPREVQLAVSDDGEAFVPAGTAKPRLAPGAEGPHIEQLAIGNLAVRARWIRVRAVNMGTVPSGVPAAGTKAWLFTDEVVVATGAEDAT